MNRGKLIALDTPDRLRAAHREPILEVHTKDSPRAVEALQRAPGVVQSGMFGRTVHVTVDDVDAARRTLPGLLASHGIALDDAELPQIPPSLEDVFISLVRAAGGAVVS
jgi:ABC-2 type transport system ATP-binding protein